MPVDKFKSHSDVSPLKFFLSRDRRSIVVKHQDLIEAVIPVEGIRICVKESSLVLRSGSAQWGWDLDSATEVSQVVVDLHHVLDKAVRGVRLDFQGLSAGMVLGLVLMMTWTGLFAPRAPLVEAAAILEASAPVKAPSQTSGGPTAGEPVDLTALSSVPDGVQELGNQAFLRQEQVLREQSGRQMQEIMTEIDMLRRQAADLAMENRILRDQVEVARKYPIWTPSDLQPAAPSVGYEVFGFKQGSAGAAPSN